VLRFEIAWPNKALSPNSRSHWSVKSKAVKIARHGAKYSCLNAIGVTGWVPTAAPQVKLTFHPIDKRRRDMDNCIASCKGVLDGIADALCVDDRYFVLSFAFGETRKPAMVVVEVS